MFWFLARQIAERLGLFAVPVGEQNAKFKSVGLNRVTGERKLNEVLGQYLGKKYDERDGMFSEHLVLLASIAVSNHQIKSVLEIGTFDGQTALILSKFFQKLK